MSNRKKVIACNQQSNSSYIGRGYCYIQPNIKMPSTLQFKFNINLDDIVESRGRFFPSEYADITSEKGEWKLMPQIQRDAMGN